MLRQTVVACPDDLWAAPAAPPQNEVWQVAYHAAPFEVAKHVGGQFAGVAADDGHIYSAM